MYIKIVTPDGVYYFPDDELKIVVADCGPR